MTSAFTECFIEDAALGWLEALGYAVLHGPAIAAGEPAAERSDPSYRDVVLEGRLRQVQQNRGRVEEPRCPTRLPKLISGELRVKDAERLLEPHP